MFLKRKIVVNQTELMNRIVLPPMASEKSEGGQVTDALCDYYREIVKDKATGLVILEHSYVEIDGKASQGQLSIADDSVIEGLKKLVKVIHQGEAKAIAQISHAGSKASFEVTGRAPVAPSAVAIPNRKVAKMPEALSYDGIQSIIQAFKDAAVRAIEAGVDGVEIHSAHGFLLNQFYSPLTNQRTDAYGGSLENRIRIHLELLSEIREVIGADKILAVRLGASDDYPGGSLLDDAIRASRMFEAAGMDLLDISGGLFGFSGYGDKVGYFRETTKAHKAQLSVPVLLTGGIRTACEANRLLEEGAADLIGVGRAVLKNPRWAKEALAT